MSVKKLLWKCLRLVFSGAIFVFASVLELLEGGEALCRRLEAEA